MAYNRRNDDHFSVYRGGESYRPADPSRTDSHRDRDRDTGRSRNWDTGPPRRGPDRRDSRDSRDTDRPPERDKSDLHLNTGVLTGPRGSASKSSPLTSRSAPPRQSSVSNTKATDGTTASSPSLTTQKSKEHQEAFEKVNRLCDVVAKRSFVRGERDRKKRDIERQRSEAKIYSGKTEEFPSVTHVYSQVKSRADLDFYEIDKRYKTIEEDYKQAIEDVIAMILNLMAGQSSPAAAPLANPSNAALTALEEKFGEFQTNFAQAQQKIKDLETDRENDKSRIDKLSARCEDLEQTSQTLKTQCSQFEETSRAQATANSTLQSENILLKQEVAELKSGNGKDLASSKKEKSRVNSLVAEITRRLESIDNQIAGLEQQKISLTDHNGMKDQLQRTEKRLNGFAEQQDEIKKLDLRTQTHEKMCKELAVKVQTIDDNVSKEVEKLANLQSQIDRFEPSQVLQMVNDWTTLDIPKTIRKLKKDMRGSSVKKESPIEPESDKAAGQQPQAPDKSWKEEITTLKSGAAQTEKQMTQLKNVTEQLGKWVTEQCKNLRTATQAMVSDALVEIGTVVDTIDGRVKKVESNPHIRDSPWTPALTPQLEARVSSLESQARNSPAAVTDEDLEVRVKALIDPMLVSMEQRLNAFSQNASAVDNALKMLQTSVSQHAQSLDVLSTMCNNINTTGMAERILAHLDEYSARYGQRIEVLEQKSQRVEEKMTALSTHVTQHSKLMNGLDPRKRSASPATLQLSEGASKKAKLGTMNGAPAVEPLRNGADGPI